MIIHWSYSHRREAEISTIVDPIWRSFYNAIRDTSWPECETESHLSQLPQRIQDEVKANVNFNSYYNCITYF